MNLTFLSAAVPLTKTIAYNNRDDQYTVSPYPMISRITSCIETATNTREFAELLQKHAALGHCLLKGGLDQPLCDESRAGHALDELHTWVCFDFDKVNCPPTMDGALAAIGKYLPTCCHNVEAIVQLSASCFNPRSTKLSAHVFMLLEKPMSTEELTAWLTSINFTGALLPEIRLSDSGNALSLPLDRTVAQPSKLLYIAPPKSVGFVQPLSGKDSIKRFPGKKPKLAVGKFDHVPRETFNDKINALRKANNLNERQFNIQVLKGIEILSDPGECVFHDVRSSGDGFIRLNVNGGDSLAYFINLREPHLVGNFKGEPYMYTREANEAFFKALTQAVQKMPSQSRTSPTTDVMAFYATNRGSKIYVGTYDRTSDTMRVDISADGAAAAWLKQFGIPVQNSLPHYDLLYDIQSNIRYEEGYPVINLYERTNFIKEWSECDRVVKLPKCLAVLEKDCPVLYKTMKSMTGDDERCLLGFVNWLAYIFQTRKKTDTAWLLWGVPGTGKGKFLQHVIRPLFGQANVVQILMNSVDGRFNSMLEGKIMYNIDEAEMSRSRDKVEAMAKIKNWITEPTIFINEKQVVEREVPSFINFIFTSNSVRPILIEPEDRRFHVAKRQETRLQYYANEYAILEQGEELPAFAQLLGELIVDEIWVRNPEANEYKTALFETTHSIADRVGMAIHEGDTAFFIDARPPDIQLQTGLGKGLLPIREYDQMLQDMIDGKLTVLRREDLYVLFQVVINDARNFPDNPTEQRRIYQRYNLTPSSRAGLRDRRNNKLVYGVKAPKWKELPEGMVFNKGEVIDEHEDATEDAESNVLPISRKKK